MYVQYLSPLLPSTQPRQHAPEVPLVMIRRLLHFLEFVSCFLGDVRSHPGRVCSRGLEGNSLGGHHFEAGSKLPTDK